MQRQFDIENEKDMRDLWDILPDRVFKIHTSEEHIYYSDGDETQYFDVSDLIAINWHDKTEITRPIQEATEADVGKLCKFWSGKDYAIGILKEIDNSSDIDIYGMEDGKNGSWFIHCRRLTKQEIEELC
jgi:hypothetical protein